MAKRENTSAGRRTSTGESPIAAGNAHCSSSAGVTTFTALSEAQWQSIRSTRDWPEGRDWRGMIEIFGQRFREAQAKRKIWVQKLRGKDAANEKERVYAALRSIARTQSACGRLAHDDLDENQFPDPGLKLREQRFKAWLSDYDAYVTPFVGKSDPNREHLEWQLMLLWIEAGGKLEYSRKKDDPGTPYGPLIDFLALTLGAVLGKSYRPSGIAKVIDRHRPQIAQAFQAVGREVRRHRPAKH